MPPLAVPLAALLAGLLAAPGAAVAEGKPSPAAPPAVMKAIRFHAFGGPEVLVYEDAPRPRPGPGEMLIEVHAAGVNPVDWKVRKGMIRGLDPTLPRIPGYDVSGVVVEAGEGVSRFKAGDAVFAYLSLRRGGAYAQYAIVREDEAAPKPTRIDHVAAAAVPLAALTAWQALFDAAGLSAGQTVLIHAAAGGVGTFAVQLARSRGAEVVGTASATNRAFLEELGAKRVIDYKTERFEEVVHDVDVVLDSVGGDTLRRSFKSVKRGGIIVSIVDDPARLAPPDGSVRTASILVRPDASQLARIAALIDEGKVKPVVSRVMPLAEAARAHEASEGGHTRGKLVLRVVD